MPQPRAVLSLPRFGDGSARTGPPHHEPPPAAGQSNSPGRNIIQPNEAWRGGCSLGPTSPFESGPSGFWSRGGRDAGDFLRTGIGTRPKRTQALSQHWRHSQQRSSHHINTTTRRHGTTTPAATPIGTRTVGYDAALLWSTGDTAASSLGFQKRGRVLSWLGRAWVWLHPSICGVCLPLLSVGVRCVRLDPPPPVGFWLWTRPPSLPAAMSRTRRAAE